MGLKRVTAPANDPVTLTEAKAHLRVDFTDDDTFITALISAATDYVDGPRGFLGRALIDQTWDYYLDRFPDHHFTNYGYSLRTRQCHIEIPLPPLIEVVGVFYLDANGDEQEMDAATYSVDDASEPARVSPIANALWPQAQCVENAVRIRFRAGYIDTTNSPAVDDVPGTIRAAILLHIGDLYENRETNVVGLRSEGLPWASEQLLRPHRVYLSMA